MRYTITILFFIIACSVWARDKKSDFIGTNVILLTQLTLNLNYSYEIKPFITAVATGGYMYNLDPNPELDENPQGYFESALSQCGAYGITVFRQNGGFMNLGGYINFRSVYDTQSFFRFGIFIHNTYLHELTRSWCHNEYRELLWVKDKDNSLYISGLSWNFGYEFFIVSRFKANVEAKFSVPTGNYKSINHYDTTIPDMGTEGQMGLIFPSLVVILKYRLRD